MKNICIILARKNSKRIKNKNIKSFCGKPLIYYSINLAKKSKLFERIIVSTDSLKIKKIAEKYSAEVPFLRNKKLSNDYASTKEVLNDVVDKISARHEYNIFCIYCTAPLLIEKDLINALKIFKNSKDINKPAIVKVQEKKRKLERAFFTVSSFSDYKKKSESKIKQGIISKNDLKNAVIEQLAIGTYLNFNYFHTPISKNVDFLGIERRLQTNIHDYNALPAKQQLELDIDVQNIEVGHTPASIRESLLEKVITMGDKFVAAVKKEYSPGIIGPFSLQSVITKDLEIIVYDVSLRVPGNPILATTSPYTKYQYGQTFGVGRRIAMEIKRAYEDDALSKIVT